ncbi:putative carboxypeptidase C24C9.08 [Cladobotryum mycophilum]|uniref:Carboxypeptidase C24C9.08 n=1 Tax=Cladobotryum mycophilum TaxID=491253 RepID=A0ABR0SIU5_9HYPO
MPPSTLLRLASIASALPVLVSGAIPQAQHPLNYGGHRGGHHGDDGGRGSHFRCDPYPPLDPSDDGLASSKDVFSGIEAIDLLVKRHQPLVQMPSICYDDLGDFDEDPRWKPFHDIPPILQETYPNVDRYATVELINRFGLIYTVAGSDANLSPILLTAHQDVVPTTGYLYGRGASDDKSAITAIMSAMEALLEQPEYKPRRTVDFAFGFDEECSGARGAASMSKHLEERYGEVGIAVILDEGGAGLQKVDDVLYALPAVYEKGYLDVWFDISTIGGHSSSPTPHTSIGMISEILVALEAHPFQPHIDQGSPVHESLICLARYSPHYIPQLTHLVNAGRLDQLALLLSRIQETQYLIQTSQAATEISGGQKINALPEFVSVGVNHRFAPHDSIGSIQHRAFEGDEDYKEYLASQGLVSQGELDASYGRVSYDGTLVLEARKKSYVIPQSPTSGPVWDVFAGTVRHTFADQASRVVPAPGAMTGNTDTHHYLNLSKNIYQWGPGSLESFGNIYTINEKLKMSEHVNMAKFYYDFIHNFDQADL